MSKTTVGEATNAKVKIEPREVLRNALLDLLKTFRKLKTVSRALRNFSSEVGDEELPGPHDDELNSLCEQLEEHEARLGRAIDEAWDSFPEIP